MDRHLDTLQHVEVVDPTHPLFGRRFPLVATSRAVSGPGYAWVVYRDDVQLRLPLTATDVAATPRPAPTTFTLEAIADLLALAGPSEGLCQLIHPTSGGVCPTTSTHASLTTSPSS